MQRQGTDLNSRLQFNDSHSMPRLSQTDLKNVFLAVMVPSRRSDESSLHNFVSSRCQFSVHRFQSRVSSVSSFAVNLFGGKQSFLLISITWSSFKIEFQNLPCKRSNLPSISFYRPQAVCDKDLDLSRKWAHCWCLRRTVLATVGL